MGARGQCITCGVHDTGCLSGRCTCRGGGTTPENGVVTYAGANATALDLSRDQTLSDGEYTLAEGTYSHKITVTGTVTLNIEGDVTFNVTKPITLGDVAEDTDYGTGAENVSLTINATGHSVTLADNVSELIENEHGGTLTLNGGTYSGGDQFGYFIRSYNGTLTFDGCTVKDTKKTPLHCSGTVNINGNSTIVSNPEYIAIDVRNDDKATINFNSGVIKDAIIGIWNEKDGATLAIGKDAKFENNKTADVFLCKTMLLNFDSNYAGDAVKVNTTAFDDNGSAQITKNGNAAMKDKLIPTDDGINVSVDENGAVWFKKGPSARDFTVNAGVEIAYTGAEQKPNVTVKTSDRPEDQGKNYTITKTEYYKDGDDTNAVTPKDAGSYYAKVYVEGYDDPVQVPFTIAKADLSSYAVEAAVPATMVAGQTPAVTVTADDLTDADYELVYKRDGGEWTTTAPDAKGTWTVGIRAKSTSTNFTGEKELGTVKVVTEDDFKVYDEKVTYDGNVHGFHAIEKPEDYELETMDLVYYTTPDCTGTPVVPKDVGVYYTKLPIKDHPELTIIKKLEIVPAIVTKDTFVFTYDGNDLTYGNTIAMTAGKDALEKDLDVKFLTSEGYQSVDVSDFDLTYYQGDEKLDYLPTMPGTYDLKVKVGYKGTANMSANDEVMIWNCTYTVKAETADFTVSDAMKAEMVYNGTTSYEPTLDYDTTKYPDVKFEYYIMQWNSESQIHEEKTVEHPIEGGTYYLRVLTNGETLENSKWQFTILPGEYDASKFHATLDGETVKQTDVPALELAADKLDMIYDRLKITYEGQPNVSLDNFSTEVFTEDGKTKISYGDTEHVDKNGNLKAGTYLVKIYFDGTDNLKGQEQQRDEEGNYVFVGDSLYRCLLTISGEQYSELKPAAGLTKNDEAEGGYTLDKNYELTLPEDEAAAPVTEPITNNGTIKSGKFEEKVTGGTITGGTFNEVEKVEEISGGVFAQEPKTRLAEGGKVSNPVDSLKIVDQSGAELNDRCTVNDVIGAKTNGVAVMALSAENSIEAAPVAYIVGSGNKITVKNADATRKAKQWIVDSGDGKPQVINGETVSFTVDASDKTVTVTAVFEGQEQPKPVDPTPSQPEVKEPEYTITVEDGQINGKASATVKAGDTVSLTVGEVPESMAFLYWDIPTELMQALTEQDVNFNNKEENLSFTMPKLAENAEKSFTIRAAFGTAETADDGIYTALGVTTGVVAGGAAVTVAGWQLYNIGTDLYLKAVLPKGAAVPANRQELALLLWQDAGKPEAVTAPYADIAADQTDAQKAARWAVANGLLDAADEDTSVFAPAKTVRRFTVIKAWNKAQNLKKQ